MKTILPFAAAVLAAGCASFDGRALQPGRSTAAEVEAVMGLAADRRPAAGGETVYYFPRLPWGYATYAARIAPDGTLIALEQRLTLEYTGRVRSGVTRAGEVLDLLGPPFQPVKAPLSGNDLWTYPMRVPGDPTPKWFLVQLSPDGVVRETYTINDPHWDQPDSPRRSLR